LWRSRLRYPSDLTDAEWAYVEPVIPPAKNAVAIDVRERAIPKDLPPRSTLYDYFDLWGWDGTRLSASTRRSTRSAGKPHWRRDAINLTRALDGRVSEKT
jgi:transposase